MKKRVKKWKFLIGNKTKVGNFWVLELWKKLFVLPIPHNLLDVKKINTIEFIIQLKTALPKVCLTFEVQFKLLNFMAIFLETKKIIL